MKNKKADILDLLSFVIIAFVLVAGFFILSFVIPYITGGLRTAGLNNSVEGIDAINRLENYGTNGIQKGVFWVFIALFISVLISSFYSDTHPIWLFLYIFFLIVTIILAAYLANAYETMINLGSFNNWNQSYMSIIMQHIIPITIGLACASFIIIFTKRVVFG